MHGAKHNVNMHMIRNRRDPLEQIRIIHYMYPIKIIGEILEASPAGL